MVSSVCTQIPGTVDRPWIRANRAQYAEIPFRSIVEEDVVDVAMPSMQGVAEDEGEQDSVLELLGRNSRFYVALDALSALTVQDSAPSDVYSTPPQLDGELVTFTLLPRARWQTLLNLDVIHQRNKPKEPPKQPEKAPFFLPSLPGVEQRFALEDDDAKKRREAEEAEEAEKAKKERLTRRLQRAAGESESVFFKKLTDAHETHSADCRFPHSLSLSCIDRRARRRGVLQLCKDPFPCRNGPRTPLAHHFGCNADVHRGAYSAFAVTQGL